MYETHFGCRESPFRMTPDPRFFFPNAPGEEAFAMLRYAIDGRKGFALLTGEVGTGKTTLLRRLMAEIGDTPFVLLFNPRLSFDEMLLQILHELELPDPPPGRRAAIESLNRFLLARASRGQTTALLVDEAQDLTEDTLEELRLLSNLETDGAKLLQIILVGQLELEEMLSRPSMRQLRQRIALRARLQRVSPAEVGDLVRHRLHVAGAARDDLFEPRALRLVARYSEGLPRLVNVVCDNAMLAAYADSSAVVRETHVREAAADLALGAKSASSPVVLSEPVEEAMRVVGWSTARAAERPDSPAPRTVALPWMLTIAAITAVSLLLASSGSGQALSRIAREGLGLIGVRSAAGEISRSPAPPASWPRAMRPIPVEIAPVSVAPGPAPQARPVEERETLVATKPREAVVARRAKPPAPPPRDETRVAAVPAAGSAVESAWPELPPRSEPFSIRVRSGLSLLVIAAAVYGPHCALGLDLLREENPEITDLNVIRAGDRVRVPRVDRTRLVRDGGDGTLEIVVTLKQTRSGARRIAEALTRETGIAARVDTRHLSPGLSYHRVIAHRVSPHELDATWRQLVEGNFVPREGVPERVGSFDGPVGAVCVVS